jgi:hypothetical protein
MRIHQIDFEIASTLKRWQSIILTTQALWIGCHWLRISCLLNWGSNAKRGENRFAQVTFGGAEGVRTPYLLTAGHALTKSHIESTIKGKLLMMVSGVKR